jgi:ribosomal-protein-alanine N-acetyltransferase
MNWSVELMVPGDEPHVAEIARASAAKLDIEAERRRSWSRIWVARAESGGSARAFLLAWVVADELHILDLATDPTSRRRGAARALLTRVVDVARELRARLVLLEVRRSNSAAIALYRAHGFGVTALRRDYYADTRDDALEMTLRLDVVTGRTLPVADEIELD